jgi:hypothetical protein
MNYAYWDACNDWCDPHKLSKGWKSVPIYINPTIGGSYEWFDGSGQQGVGFDDLKGSNYE